MYDLGYFNHIDSGDVYYSSYLNDFINLGKEKTSEIRLLIQKELCDEFSILKSKFKRFFHVQNEVIMKLPIRIGDYTDFYSSKFHAENVGKLFRNPENALPPNWLTMPIAYHGRSSSIVVSGTEITRPCGQSFSNDKTELRHQPSSLLDFELEMATIIGRENTLGNPISCDDAQDYVFGYALFNDWSARDLQKWEYQPLGPFTGKNFASTLSPWIVMTDALEAFKTNVIEQVEPLNYLKSVDPFSYDIELLAFVNGVEVTHTNFKHLYWNPSQQIAHHTVNGCNLRVGDILASGTISGPGKTGKGCLLEITEGGKTPLILKNGAQRLFLEDGDEVRLKGSCVSGDIRIGFGDNWGVIKANKL